MAKRENELRKKIQEYESGQNDLSGSPKIEMCVSLCPPEKEHCRDQNEHYTDRFADEPCWNISTSQGASDFECRV